MKTQFIVTITGPEKQGMVNELAKLTTEAGGKWSNMKLAHLEGQFACIFKVDIDAANAPALKKELTSHEAYKVTIAEPQSMPRQEITMRLNVGAADRPGLVQDISHKLSDLGVDIDELDCHRVGTYQAGMMFTGTFILRASADVNASMILSKLEEMGERMKLNLEVK